MSKCKHPLLCIVIFKTSYRCYNPFGGAVLPSGMVSDECSLSFAGAESSAAGDRLSVPTQWDNSKSTLNRRGGSAEIRFYRSPPFLEYRK